MLNILEKQQKIRNFQAYKGKGKPREVRMSRRHISPTCYSLKTNTDIKCQVLYKVGWSNIAGEPYSNKSKSTI